MEDIRLKQRLVGAIVLVSLAVIFIPMILSGGDPAVSRLSGTNIPEKPDRDFVSRIIPLDKQAPEPGPIVAPKAEMKPEVKSEPKVVAKTEVKPTPAPKTAVKPKPVTKSTSKTATATTSKPVVRKGVSAWVVQVGSFDSSKNAYGLRDKLKGKGFNAFVDSIHQKDKTTYRVRIGPEVKKTEAEQMLAKVQKITGSKGFVTHYP